MLFLCRVVVVAATLTLGRVHGLWDCENQSSGGLNLALLPPGQNKTYSARNCIYTSDVRVSIRPGGVSGSLDFRFENCRLGTGYMEIGSGQFERFTLTIVGGSGLIRFNGASVNNSNITIIRPVAAAPGSLPLAWHSSTLINTVLRIAVGREDSDHATGQLASLPELQWQDMIFTDGSLVNFEGVHVRSFSNDDAIRAVGDTRFSQSTFRLADSVLGSTSDAIGLQCPSGSSMFTGSASLFHVTNSTFSTAHCTFEKLAMARFSGRIAGNQLDIQSRVALSAALPDMRVVVDTDCPGYSWRGKFLLPLQNSGLVGSLKISLSTGDVAANRVNFTADRFSIGAPGGVVLHNCYLPDRTNITALTGQVYMDGSEVSPLLTREVQSPAGLRWHASVGRGSTIVGDSVIIRMTGLVAGGVTIRTPAGGSIRISQSWVGEDSRIESLFDSPADVAEYMEFSRVVLVGTDVRFIGNQHNDHLTEFLRVSVNSGRIANGTTFTFQRLRVTGSSGSYGVRFEGNAFEGVTSVTVADVVCHATHSCFEFGDNSHTTPHLVALCQLTMSNLSVTAGQSALHAMASNVTLGDIRVHSGSFRIRAVAAPGHTVITTDRIRFGATLEHAFPPTMSLPSTFSQFSVMDGDVNFYEAVWASPFVQLHVTTGVNCAVCHFPSAANISVAGTLTLTDWSAGEGTRIRAGAIQARNCNASMLPLRQIFITSTAETRANTIVNCAFERSVVTSYAPVAFPFTGVAFTDGSTVRIVGPYTGVGMPPWDATATAGSIDFNAGSTLRDSLLTISGVVFRSAAHAHVLFVSCELIRSTVCVTNVSSGFREIDVVSFQGNTDPVVVNSTIRISNTFHHGDRAHGRFLLTSTAAFRGTTNVSLANVTTMGSTIAVAFGTPHARAVNITGLHLPLSIQRRTGLGNTQYTRVEVPMFTMVDKVTIGGDNPFDMTVKGGVVDCPPHLMNVTWAWPEGTVTNDAGNWSNFCRSIQVQSFSVRSLASELPQSFAAALSGSLLLAEAVIQFAHFTVAGGNVAVNDVSLLDSTIHVTATPSSTSLFVDATRLAMSRCRVVIDGGGVGGVQTTTPPLSRGERVHLAFSTDGAVDSLVIIRAVSLDAGMTQAPIRFASGPIMNSVVFIDRVRAAETTRGFIDAASAVLANSSVLVHRAVQLSKHGLLLHLDDSNLTVVNTSVSAGGISQVRLRGSSSVVLRGGTWPASQLVDIADASWLRATVTVERNVNLGWGFKGPVVGLARSTTNGPDAWTFAWTDVRPGVLTSTNPSEGGSVDPCNREQVRMAPSPTVFLTRPAAGDADVPTMRLSLRVAVGAVVSADMACAMSCAGIADATGFDAWGLDESAADVRTDASTLQHRVPAAFRDTVLLPTSELVPVAVRTADSDLHTAVEDPRTAPGVERCVVGVRDSGLPYWSAVTSTFTIGTGASPTPTLSSTVAVHHRGTPGRSQEEAIHMPATSSTSATRMLDRGSMESAARLPTSTRHTASVVGVGRRATYSSSAASTNDVALAAARASRFDASAARSKLPLAATGAVSVVASVVGVSVTAPNKAGTTSRIVSSALRCAYEADDDDDDDDDDWPDWSTVVLVVPVGGPAEDAAARAAGAALSTCALALVASAGLFYLHRRAASAACVRGGDEAAAAPRVPTAADDDTDVSPIPMPPVSTHPWDAKGDGASTIACARSKLWLQSAGVLYALMLSYYGPSALEAAVYAAAHGDGAAQVGIGIACIVLRVAVLLPGAAAVVVAAGNVAPDQRSDPSEAGPPIDTPAFAVYPLFEPSRDHRVLAVRILVLVDVTVADVVGILTGLQPRTDLGCSVTSYAILIVLFLSCSYLVVLRPYSSGLEQWMMIGLAVLQMALAGVVLAWREGAAGEATVGLAATAVDVATLLGIAALTCDALRSSFNRRRTTTTAGSKGVEDALLGDVPALNTSARATLPPATRDDPGRAVGTHQRSSSCGPADALGAIPPAMVNPLQR